MRVESTLQKAVEELERRIEQRTAELRHTKASLTREITERRQFSYRFLNAQEAERRRIARMLKDELAQDLSVLKLQLDSLKDQLPERQLVLKERINHIAAILSKSIQKVRSISHNLIPSVLVDLGLLAALRELIDCLAEKSEIEINSKLLLADSPLSIEQQISIFRVFQEIFMNIREHAQATRVSISVRRSGCKVFFGVEDDGIGFDIERIKSMSAAERSLGLATVEERVKMMGGNFEINSRAGAGTRIAFQIPFAAPE